jgi:ABC-type branched-subunit amino acid transport system ATPase component
VRRVGGEATQDGAIRSPEQTAHARLACSDITVRFGGLAAVMDVDLAVPDATIVGLVGPNGAGKTTVFGVLSGLVRPSHGTVLLDGEDITTMRPRLRAARGLARTFQHPELFTDLTVRDHLVLAYRAKRERRRVWSDLVTMGSLHAADPHERATVEGLVDLLGLGSVAHRPVRGLPLGVARLVELGRALASSPRVLLLDEPSSGLDLSETAKFETSLRRVSREQDISVLLVEHDVDLVMRLCEYVYVLDFGELIASGLPEQVHRNAAVRAAYLGEDRPSFESHEVATPVTVRGPETSEPAPVAAPDLAASTQGSPALEVDDLSVCYGDATALSGVSFRVAPGEALAVLGANGAGKTSLARAVSGLVRPSAGRVFLAGDDITGWPAHRIRRAGLVHLPEGRGVFRALTVTENLRMAAALEDRKARDEAVTRGLDLFPPLAARRRQPAGLLSGGEQQMLSLARALALSPLLLVADELSLGLAPKMVDLVFDGLANAKQAGVTVIMIEQYVHRALEFADRCLVLQNGALGWSGPASGAHGEVLRRYLGEAMTVDT